jgi:Saxitoxin biosynthesis operon protein SxtJ
MASTGLGEAPLPSNRSFGTLFVVVFGLIAAWSFWRKGVTYPLWLGASGLTLAVTLLAPGWLTPLNRAWMKLAELLNRVVSPIVLGVLFFLVITPFGFVKRLTGWDPMRKSFNPAVASYWIDRDPPGPAPESLDKQY